MTRVGMPIRPPIRSRRADFEFYFKRARQVNRVTGRRSGVIGSVRDQ